MDGNIKAALIRFHNFTGNDYVLSFLKWWIYQCFQIAWRILGVKRGAHSCIGKICMSFIQIQRYRYKKSPKENVRQKVYVRKKRHGSIIITTLPLRHRELEILFTQCSQAPKHNWERLDQKQWIFFGLMMPFQTILWKSWLMKTLKKKVWNSN